MLRLNSVGVAAPAQRATGGDAVELADGHDDKLAPATPKLAGARDDAHYSDDISTPRHTPLPPARPDAAIRRDLSRFGHVQAKPRRRPPRALSRAWPLRTGHATTAGPHRTSTRTTEYRALTSQFIYSRMARSHARCFRFAPPPRRISALNRALALNRCSPSSSRHRQLNRIHRRVYCSNAYNHLTNTAHLQTAAN